MMFKNIYILEQTDTFAMWPKGAIILVALLGLLLVMGLAFLLAVRVVKERARYIEERSAYIEGVLSKAEFKAMLNLLISKSSEDTPFSLAYIDLDNFTQVANAFGDKNIKNVIDIIAQRFLKVLPFQVQMGRLGSDTFVVLFRPEYTEDEVYHTCEQIKDCLKDPVRISYDTETTMSASIAIAYYPVHGENYQQLLSSLELAVYTAKRSGGDKIVVYSNELAGSESENKLYYEQIKSAINNKEFILYYQPIVSNITADVVCAEALLRWEHPTLGILNPKEFINILEQSGDIYWVGIWSVETMIQEYSRIKRARPSLDFKLSINLSIKQLMNEKIVSDINKILKKYKFAASNLVIEAEEFIIYNQHEQINDNIKKLRELGFKIAVDGFAFDYNTLLKIDKLSIDIIKLNAGFLEKDNEEIMKNFITLLLSYANKHGIDVIVERTETFENVKYFSDQGIHNFQGYYISKPISGDELVDVCSSFNHYSHLFDEKTQEDLMREAAEAIEKMNAQVDMPSSEEPAEEKEETPVEETPSEENKVDEEQPQEENPSAEDENSTIDNPKEE